MSSTPPGSGLAFRVSGIPVVIRPSFFILAVLLGIPLAQGPDGVIRVVAWVLVVLMSVLWHELGHAFAMRRLGGAPSIELYSLGGLTHWADAGRPSPAQRIFVSLAGPLAGFALGATALGVTVALEVSEDGIAGEVIAQILWVNVGWGVLNLLPMLPLDGGHVLHAALDQVTRGRGAQLARIVSLVVAGVGLGLALWAGWIWAAMLCVMLGAGTYQDYVNHRARAQDGLFDRALQQAVIALESGETGAAKAVFEQARARANHPVLRAAATEHLAWALLLEGDREGAERVAGDFPDDHRATALLDVTLATLRGDSHPASLIRAFEQLPAASRLLTALLENGQQETVRDVVADAKVAEMSSEQLVAISARYFQRGRFEDAGVLAESAFERFRDPTHAYNVACCLARLERGAEALAWLEKAFENGYRDLKQLEGDDDLSAVRAEQGYGALIERFERALG